MQHLYMLSPHPVSSLKPCRLTVALRVEEGPTLQFSMGGLTTVVTLTVDSREYCYHGSWILRPMRHMRFSSGKTLAPSRGLMEEVWVVAIKALHMQMVDIAAL